MTTIRPTPTVSVVLPVFNAEDFLCTALDSILEQDQADFELIAINDGSTDRSRALLEERQRHDPRVRLVSRANRGLVASLNEGIALARGRYIARMDADDIALPQRLRLQAAYLDQHPSCVCVGSDVELMDDAGRKLVVLQQLQQDVDIQAQALRGHTTICHPRP